MSGISNSSSNLYQQAASQAQNKTGLTQTLATGLGMAAGGYLGGTQGAALGGQFGTQIGKTF
jgi:hypothetical protein